MTDVAISDIDSGCGVYAIMRKGEMIYVGSSLNMRKRKSCHLSQLRHGRHINRRLQRSFLKNGESAFTFVCLERCPHDELASTEQRWLDRLFEIGAPLFNDLRMAYAVTGPAHPMFGRTHSDSARAKIRAARLSQVISHSAETRSKIGAGNRGKKLSDATKAKISLSKMGSKAWNIGLTSSDPRVAKHTQVRYTMALDIGLEILSSYRSGQSIETIRCRVGCCWDVVKAFLEANGEHIRSISEQKRIRDAAIRSRYPTRT